MPVVTVIFNGYAFSTSKDAKSEIRKLSISVASAVYTSYPERFQ